MGCKYRVLPVPRPPVAADHRIMATTPIRILLELQPDQESLTGQIHRAGQPPCEFTGWLGLLAALQALLAAEPGPARNPPEPEPGGPGASGDRR